MKIKFEKQDYQLEAISSVVDVFEGQPKDLQLVPGAASSGPSEAPTAGRTGSMVMETAFGNRLALSDEALLENVRRVQGRRGLTKSESLESGNVKDDGNENGSSGEPAPEEGSTEDPGELYPFPKLNLTTEMETGTGKTYVYLRTIYELNKKYGFTKFVIVVPSVAIREGVVKNLQITRDHLAALYGNTPLDYWAYDSSQVSRLRQFATSTNMQVLVMNIDAFNKPEKNVIHREHDRMNGSRPVEFIQGTSPVVLMDEPQNMEGDRAKAAIASLNPMCTLRYSATHRNLYNLIYRLSPVDAYDQKLVKQIEVASITEQDQFNRPHIQVKSLNAKKSKITARLELDVQQASGPKRKIVTVGKNDDLGQKTNGRAAYAGYKVDTIDAGRGYISFANGETLDEGESSGSNKDEIMKTQIHETVKEHLEKERDLSGSRTTGANANGASGNGADGGARIKVLSLFFIDRVANYAKEEGKLRQWFIEAYEQEKQNSRYSGLDLPEVHKVHNGYFATDPQGQAKNTSGNTKADDEAYRLIMQEKERLLSPEEPLRFIFSHSALREGWDNPNVFQICTLNEAYSELKKRQEIGRGLRLSVDASGQRVLDPQVNRLTVIANESYADFATALQNEIRDEAGVDFGGGRIKPRTERHKLQLKDNWQDQYFRELWERINQKTRYSVQYSTPDLIRRAADTVREMPEITRPKISLSRARIDMTPARSSQHGSTSSASEPDNSSEGQAGEGSEEATEEQTKATLEPQLLSTSDREFENEEPFRIPDLIGHIQAETELTRSTIAGILKDSGRLEDVAVNPQQFLDYATARVKRALLETMVGGVKYEPVEGEYYEMSLFEERELVGYEDELVGGVKNSIYDSIICDSETEKSFARAMKERTDIKLFLKLPPWFIVKTPVGKYNPDWAIVKEEHEAQKLYLVRETKFSTDITALRPDEKLKINAGYAHFSVLPDVEYKTATSAAEV